MDSTSSLFKIERQNDTMILMPLRNLGEFAMLELDKEAQRISTAKPVKAKLPKNFAVGGLFSPYGHRRNAPNGENSHRELQNVLGDSMGQCR